MNTWSTKKYFKYLVLAILLKTLYFKYLVLAILFKTLYFKYLVLEVLCPTLIGHYNYFSNEPSISLFFFFLQIANVNFCFLFIWFNFFSLLFFTCFHLKLCYFDIETIFWLRKIHTLYSSFSKSTIFSASFLTRSFETLVQLCCTNMSATLSMRRTYVS